MAALIGKYKGVYKIADFRSKSSIKTQSWNWKADSKSQRAFKEELADCVNNGVIQKFSVFESRLGGVPAPLMRLVNREGKRLCHEYVDMEIKGGDDLSLFVSLEMGQREILAQISDNEEDVTKWRLNKYGDKKKARQDVHILQHLDMTNIESLTSKNAVTFSEFLDIDEESLNIVPRYHLFRSNCQLFVRDVKSQLDMMKNSREIKFCLPGSGGSKVSIDDPTIIDHLELMYPSLTRDEITEIPEVDPQYFAFVGETHFQGIPDNNQEADAHVYRLKFQQRVYMGILDWLKSMGCQNDRNKGWRVIFNNLSPERVQTALESASMSASNVEGISAFWRQTFDILLFAPEVGCVIFQFNGGEETEETEESRLRFLNSKADMLSALSDVDVDTIHFVNVTMNDKSAVDVANTQIKERLAEINKEVVQKKVHQSNWNKLIAKLVMLNRLENVSALLHEKLEEQKWGKSNAVMFTEEQHQAIRIAQKAFRTGRPLRLAVKGPPGAGKTLVLFEIARSYVRIVEGQDKDVFIRIQKFHKSLTEHLQRRIHEDAQLFGRVIIGDDQDDDCWRSRDLILVDEAGAYEPLYEKFGQNQSVALFSSYTAFNFIPSFAEKGFESGWYEFSHSLRATRTLTDFIRYFAQLRNGGLWIPPNAGVAIQGSDPEVIKIETPWDDKRNFLQTSVTKLKALRDKFFSVPSPTGSVLVLVLGHRRLRDEIDAELINLGIRDDFTFVNHAEAQDTLGAQWPAVAILLDGLSYNKALINESSVFVNAWTRATTALLFIFHESQQNMRIEDVNSFEWITVLDSELCGRVNDIISSKFPDEKRVIVDDRRWFNPSDLNPNPHPANRLEWLKKRDDVETVDAALLIVILNYSDMKDIHGDWVSNSIAPVKAICVYPNKETLEEREQAMKDLTENTLAESNANLAVMLLP